ncbi:F0F1 ATP synthase subunit B [Marinilongibacter aquaticus]|uniref:F0F1 ATP synthase subunit B n=1 Tax=Marinilongibacter aquaticus TaxID=2975157 RepID=UPI0021BD0419|nr:F0F1 ATP synthase subunit B [Marinilongibacter aquaticus]UBM60461.1 F0F1 ATP synthase subunit B [Marinilongibacter aquaticus]
MELLTPSVGLLFWQFLIFLALVFLLRKFAWKGILSALKERENDISSALQMAEETRAEMAKLKSDNEKLLAEARAERDEILKTAKETANKLIDEAKNKATAEANAIIADAKEAISHERSNMLESLRKDVAGLSIEIAEKILRKELSDKEAQSALVSELIADARLN